jgi:hypothetical protein
MYTVFQSEPETEIANAALRNLIKMIRGDHHNDAFLTQNITISALAM